MVSEAGISFMAVIDIKTATPVTFGCRALRTSPSSAKLIPSWGLYTIETPCGPEHFIDARAFFFGLSAASRLHSMIFLEVMLDASAPVKPVSI
jgi:hypothetical protein